MPAPAKRQNTKKRARKLPPQPAPPEPVDREFVEALAEWRDLRCRIDAFNARSPAVLQRLARTVEWWPVWTGRGQVQNRDRDALFDAIELGRDLPIRDHDHKRPGDPRKNPDLATPINDVARLSLMVAQTDRARGLPVAGDLPDLSKKTAAKWASYCWNHNFLEMFPDPETEPMWFELGRHRVHGGRARTIGDLSSAERSSVRSEIRDRFMRAIKSLIR